MSSRSKTLSRTLRGTLLALALLLAGCGGVTGAYSYEEQDPDGGGTMKIVLELDSGSKATMTMSGSDGLIGGGRMIMDGTYSVDGDKVTVVMGGDSIVYTRSGDKLVGEVFGEKIELVKE